MHVIYIDFLSAFTRLLILCPTLFCNDDFFDLKHVIPLITLFFSLMSMSEEIDLVS